MDIPKIREVMVRQFGAESVSVSVEGNRATVRIFVTPPPDAVEIVEILCREMIRRNGGWSGDHPSREGKHCAFKFGARGDPSASVPAP